MAIIHRFRTLEYKIKLIHNVYKSDVSNCLTATRFFLVIMLHNEILLDVCTYSMNSNFRIYWSESWHELIYRPIKQVQKFHDNTGANIYEIIYLLAVIVVGWSLLDMVNNYSPEEDAKFASNPKNRYLLKYSSSLRILNFWMKMLLGLGTYFNDFAAFTCKSKLFVPYIQCSPTI